MKIINCKNKEKAVKGAAEALTKYFTDNKNLSILFLASGGSALSILEKISAKTLSANITITVLDTRLGVSPKDENFNQLSKTDFYKRASGKDIDFLNPLIHSNILQNVGMNEIAEQFNEMLKKWIGDNPKGKIVATVGMGPDGHIAGIIPFPDSKEFEKIFDDGKNFAAAYRAPLETRFPDRLTVTYPFLMKADLAVSYIVGREKRQKLADLISPKDFPVNQFPGVILRTLKNVFIFTDIK